MPEDAFVILPVVAIVCTLTGLLVGYVIGRMALLETRPPKERPMPPISRI